MTWNDPAYTAETKADGFSWAGVGSHGNPVIGINMYAPTFAHEHLAREAAAAARANGYEARVVKHDPPWTIRPVVIG